MPRRKICFQKQSVGQVIESSVPLQSASPQNGAEDELLELEAIQSEGQFAFVSPSDSSHMASLLHAPLPFNL
jgi:hypothetical protein